MITLVVVTLSNAQYYMKLPYDLSGSIAKNRFRNELLWGLKKIYDLYKLNKPFTVVFDYCCDIEVHLNNGFEFYQIKTDDGNGTYTVDKLLKRNKSGQSVLGKLYILKYNENGIETDKTKIALVSSIPFNDGKEKYNSCEQLDFNEIDKNAIRKIKDKIRNELSLSKEINLKNSYFIRTNMDLTNPDKTLIGETAIFFEEIFGYEAKKVHSLYRVLACEISKKACYELKIEKYQDLLIKKGINNNYIEDVLQQYNENTDLAVSKAKEFIELEYKDNFSKRLKSNKILADLIIDLGKYKYLKKIELKIADYIRKHLDSLPQRDIDIINHILHIMKNKISIEITEENMKILILLTLKKYEEGVYEQFNN